MQGLTQPSPDSTARVPVERWALWRLIHDAERAYACDSLVTELEKEVNLGLRVEAFADSLLLVKDRQIEMYQRELGISEQRRENQVKFTQEIKKDVKKWKFLAGVGGVLLVVVLIL